MWMPGAVAEAASTAEGAGRLARNRVTRQGTPSPMAQQLRRACIGKAGDGSEPLVRAIDAARTWSLWFRLI